MAAGNFGSCCNTLKEAMSEQEFDPLIAVGDDGILYMSVGLVDVAPTVLSSGFELDLPRQTIRVRFNENVAPSIVPGAISLTNLTTNQTIAAAHIAAGYDAATNTASFTFPGLPDGVLPDGNYRLTLAAGAASDLYGNPTAAAHTLNFFFLQGDANHDGRVNLQDFNRLAGNFGQGNRTFSQGDFNYDDIVDISDFSLLALAFNQSLPAPGDSPRATPGAFSSTAIDHLDADDRDDSIRMQVLG